MAGHDADQKFSSAVGLSIAEYVDYEALADPSPVSH
jgi:hypothetical protein